LRAPKGQAGNGRQDGSKGRSIAVAIKEAIERYGIIERWQQDRLVAQREA
jgi:hypothetical protein